MQFIGDLSKSAFLRLQLRPQYFLLHFILLRNPLLAIKKQNEDHYPRKDKKQTAPRY
jgi:hypothetical protein